MPLRLENLGKITAEIGFKSKAAPTSHLFRDVRKPLAPMAAIHTVPAWEALLNIEALQNVIPEQAESTGVN